MSMIVKCPLCKSKIPDRVKRCPICRWDLSAYESDNRKERHASRLIYFIMVVFVLIIFDHFYWVMLVDSISSFITFSAWSWDILNLLKNPLTYLLLIYLFAFFSIYNHVKKILIWWLIWFVFILWNNYIWPYIKENFDSDLIVSNANRILSWVNEKLNNRNNTNINNSWKNILDESNNSPFVLTWNNEWIYFNENTTSNDSLTWNVDSINKELQNSSSDENSENIDNNLLIDIISNNLDKDIDKDYKNMDNINSNGQFTDWDSHWILWTNDIYDENSQVIKINTELNNEIINSNVYYFPLYNLKISFWQDDSYSANMTWNRIDIFYNWNLTVSLTSFKCSESENDWFEDCKVKINDENYEYKFISNGFTVTKKWVEWYIIWNSYWFHIEWNPNFVNNIVSYLYHYKSDFNHSNSLLFNSVLWTKYYISKNFFYQWKSLTAEEISSIWLDCAYKLMLIEYQRKENIEISPDIVIYECSLENSNIESIWNSKIWLMVWKSNKKKYLIKVNNLDYLDYEKFIDIY